MLTRRIRYEDLRKGIRKACIEHLEEASRGQVECPTKGATKGPIRFRVHVPRGPVIEPELHLGRDAVQLVLDDVVLSNYADLPEEFKAMLAGTKLTLGGPILSAAATLKDGMLKFEPVRLPYAHLRPVLYYLTKRLLPSIAAKYVDATFRFSDPDYTISFKGSKTAAAKFEGEIAFTEKHVVLQLELKRLAVMFSPVVANQLDAQLQEWTDGWDDDLAT